MPDREKTAATQTTARQTTTKQMGERTKVAENDYLIIDHKSSASRNCYAYRTSYSTALIMLISVLIKSLIIPNTLNDSQEYCEENIFGDRTQTNEEEKRTTTAAATTINNLKFIANYLSAKLNVGWKSLPSSDAVVCVCLFLCTLLGTQRRNGLLDTE